MRMSATVKHWAGVVVVFAAMSAEATDGVWVWREGVGLSATAAADWSDPQNWQSGILPDLDGKALIVNTTGVQRWIRIPAEGVSVGNISVAGSTSTVSVFGGTIFTAALDRNEFSCLEFFSDVTLSPHAWINVPDGAYTWFRGRLTTDENLISAGSAMAGTIGLDFARWANTGDAFRAGEFCQDLSMSYGSFEINFPTAMTAANGTWTTIAGSSWVTYAGSGPRGTELAVGASVTSAAFPSGTFVRRIVADDLVEFSAAALESQSASVIAFSDYVPRLTIGNREEPISLKVFQYSGSMLTLNANEQMMGDCRVYARLDTNGEGGVYPLHVKSTRSETTNGLPRLVLSCSERWMRTLSQLTVYNGLLEFAPTNGTSNGYFGGQFQIHGRVTQAQGYWAFVHVNVNEGETTTIDSMNFCAGDPGYGAPRLFKWGKGALEIKAPIEKVDGWLHVKEGVFGLSSNLDTAQSITRLQVDAGARFRIRAGTGGVTLPSFYLKEQNTSYEHVVPPNGIPPCITVTDTSENANFSNGGTILLSGDIDHLPEGEWPLWKAARLYPSTLSKWTLVAPESRRRILTLAAKTGELSVIVRKKDSGFCVLFR